MKHELTIVFDASHKDFLTITDDIKKYMRQCEDNWKSVDIESLQYRYNITNETDQ